MRVMTDRKRRNKTWNAVKPIKKHAPESSEYSGGGVLCKINVLRHMTNTILVES